MNNDNNKQDKEQIAPGSKVDGAAKQQKSGGGALSLFNFLLILGLAGAAAWFWLTQWQGYMGNMASTTQSLKTEIGTLSSDLQQQASVNGKLDGMLDTLESNQQALQRQLMTIDGRRSHDWVFAESEYLIRLAGRKLWLEHDVATAVALLDSADLRVASLADSSLLALRQALASDITSLKNLPLIDVDGISLKLTAITSQLDELPLSLVELPEAVDVEVTELTDSPADWKYNLGKIWDGVVEDFISIHRRNGEVQTLLSVDQSWYLAANLRLAIQQAQLSALQHQGARYEASLNLAIKLLKQYYNKQDVAVKNTLNTLNMLVAQNVEQRLPNDLNSRAVLAELLEKRVKGLPDGTLGMASNHAESQERVQ